MINQHQTTRDLIEKYNKPRPLEGFLLPFIGDKKEVKIADVGSGPFSIIGSYLDGVDVRIYHSDKQDFIDFWIRQNAQPFILVEHQDMEKLKYPDELFNIVVCINALDHTKDAFKAVQEMIRVCKIGGYVYIDSCLDQLDTGHKHYWNAKEDGRFTNNLSSFGLENFGFNIKFIDNGGESRYNHIVAILERKP